jgi:hypothetical protein
MTVRKGEGRVRKNGQRDRIKETSVLHRAFELAEVIGLDPRISIRARGMRKAASMRPDT